MPGCSRAAGLPSSDAPRLARVETLASDLEPAVPSIVARYLDNDASRDETATALARDALLPSPERFLSFAERQRTAALVHPIGKAVGLGGDRTRIPRANAGDGCATSLRCSRSHSNRSYGDVLGLSLSVVWYGAAAAFVLSLIAFVRPTRRLGMPTRRRASVIMAIALAVFVLLSIVPPAGDAAWPSRTSDLDEVAPTYHYAERHSRYINASPERVYSATKTVVGGGNPVVSDVHVDPAVRAAWTGKHSERARAHAASRRGAAIRLRAALRPSAARGRVRRHRCRAAAVARGKGRLTPELYRSISAPGFVKATMNFRIEPDGSRIAPDHRDARARHGHRRHSAGSRHTGGRFCPAVGFFV